MVHTAKETLTFIDESRYAFEGLLQSLSQALDTRDGLSQKLARTLEEEKLFNSILTERDLWSPQANYQYFDFISQIEKSVGNKKVPQELLSRLRASHMITDVISSAILQIAVRVLYFRFATKPQLKQARLIGSQSVIDLIWEGARCVSIGETSSDAPAIQNVLEKLEQEQGIKMVPGGNNASAILAALGWSATDAIIQELRTLVAAR